MKLGRLRRKWLNESEPFNPTAGELGRIDEAAARIATALPVKPGWFDYYALNHRGRLAHDLQLTQRWIPKTEPIVEFGAVPLLLTAALSLRGFNVTGVDVDPSRFESAISALKLRIDACDIERQRLPFGDETFGAAIFNEVFEHLRIDLNGTFREVRRVLRPGARLLLSTPNGRSYSNLRNLLCFDRGLEFGIYDCFDALEAVGHMGHVREYTVTDVAEFLERTGFVIERVIYRGRYATNFQQLVVRMMPALRPHFTIIARRV